MRASIIVLVAGILGFPGWLAAHSASRELADAAIAFLSVLEPEQSRRTVFPVNDAERGNWHFVPKERNGLKLKEMTPLQRERAMALLRAGLSERGHAQAQAIMGLEKILFEIEGRDHRDAGLYTFSVFGTPSANGVWGWRVEGHHLSVNFTLVGSQHVSTTPSFFGSNPAEIRTGPQKGQRALGELEDLGRSLLLALDPVQRSVALFSAEAPRDIITGNQRRITLEKPEGLPAARMNPTQRGQLEQLVRAYVFRHREDVATEDLRKISEAGWDQVHFAWAGGPARGEAHYYRVQGPTFLIEYDNVQNSANHVHAVWRDPEADFGRDVLREHYANEHGAKPAK